MRATINTGYSAAWALFCSKVFITLTVVFAPLLAKAQNATIDVALLINFEDISGNLTEADFNRTVSVMRSQVQTPVRAVFIRRGLNQQQRLEAIGAALQPNDRVAAITFGTHGRSLPGATRLTRLGYLTTAGPVGFITKIFESLNGRLSPDLFIYLNACSTVCGLKVDVEARVGGLFNHLKKYGVRNLAVWGAKQKVNSGAEFGLPLDPRPIRPRPSLMTNINSNVVGALTTFIAVSLLNRVPNIDASAFSGLFILTSMPVTYGLSAWATQTVLNAPLGTAGLLIAASESGIESEPVDGNDPKLQNLVCDESLNP